MPEDACGKPEVGKAEALGGIPHVRERQDLKLREMFAEGGARRVDACTTPLLGERAGGGVLFSLSWLSMMVESFVASSGGTSFMAKLAAARYDLCV